MQELRPFSTVQRYHSLAILLHWSIALALLFMFVSGLYMVNVDISKADQYKLFQIHKGAGVLLLFAIVLRFLVRWLTLQPALPESLSETEKRLSKTGHAGLYLAMLAMPLSGWLMVSASPFGLPTIVFDWFQWPHIPGVARNKVVESMARNIHWYTALSFILLIAIHVFAVIKHQVKDNINLLPRIGFGKSNEK